MKLKPQLPFVILFLNLIFYNTLKAQDPSTDPFLKSMHGTVTTLDRQPLSDVSVRLIHPNGYEVRSSTNGEFLFDALPSNLDRTVQYPFRFFKNGYAFIDTLLYPYTTPAILMRKSREICIQVFKAGSKGEFLPGISASASNAELVCPKSDKFGYIRIKVPNHISDNQSLRISFSGGVGYQNEIIDYPVQTWLSKPIDVYLKPAKPGPKKKSFAEWYEELNTILNRLTDSPGDEELQQEFSRLFKEIDTMPLSEEEREKWLENREGFLDIKNYLDNKDLCKQSRIRREEAADRYNRNYNIAQGAQSWNDLAPILDNVYESGLKILRHDREIEQYCMDVKDKEQTDIDTQNLKSILENEKMILKELYSTNKISEVDYKKRLARIGHYYDQIYKILQR